MLRPATVVDLPLFRALIRDGALRGSFDRDFATDSPAASEFFASLRQALATGYFVEKDRQTGELSTIAVPGYVYMPDSGGAAQRPTGFGLFKAAAVGYELWLTGIDAGSRGQGYGHAMLAELLRTPPGRTAYVVRVEVSGQDSATIDHLLVALGYARANATPQHAWYLRNDAPEQVVLRLNAPGAPRAGR